MSSAAWALKAQAVEDIFASSYVSRKLRSLLATVTRRVKNIVYVVTTSGKQTLLGAPGARGPRFIEPPERSPLCFSRCMFFVCHGQPISGAGNVLALFQQFNKRLYRYLSADLDAICNVFSGTKRPFQQVEQVWKPSPGGATIGEQMPEKNVKIWENGCIVCAHHFGRFEACWKKSSTMHSLLPHVL